MKRGDDVSTMNQLKIAALYRSFFDFFLFKTESEKQKRLFFVFFLSENQNGKR